VEARLRRLVAIVPWLYQQGSAKIADIAARVGVTPEQVVRDLTTASMCGLPPYTSDVLYGFWVDPEAGEVNVVVPTVMTRSVRLTGRQAVAVGIALAAIEALPGSHREVIARLRSKLAAAIGELPVAVAADEPPLIDDLRAAVERNERIRVEYVSLEDELTTRDLDPRKLFVDRGVTYLLADDHLRNAERIFRVDRLLSVQSLGTFVEPRPVSIPAGTTWTWMVPAEDVVVRLPPGSHWVLDRYATLAHTVDALGWLTVWLSVVSERWLAALLLRCGAGAEVLEPERFADLAARHARDALARYR
jgi:proteasome accessory factor C